MDLICTARKQGICLPKLSPDGNTIYNVYTGNREVAAELMDATTFAIRARIPHNPSYPHVQAGTCCGNFEYFTLLESDGCETAQLSLYRYNPLDANKSDGNNGLVRVAARVFVSASFVFGGVFSHDNQYIAVTFVNNDLSKQLGQQTSTLAVLLATDDLPLIATTSFPFHTNGPRFLQSYFWSPVVVSDEEKKKRRHSQQGR